MSLLCPSPPSPSPSPNPPSPSPKYWTRVQVTKKGARVRASPSHDSRHKTLMYVHKTFHKSITEKDSMSPKKKNENMLFCTK